MTEIDEALGIRTLFVALMVQIFRRMVTTLYRWCPPLMRLYRPVIDRGRYVLQFSPTRFAMLLYRYPALRRDDELFLSRFLKPGMTYVDVGANIGTTTLAAADAVGRTGTVIAFEPHPGTFQDLSASVALNPDLAPRISLVASAVGDTTGSARISDLPENDINHINVSHGDINNGDINRGGESGIAVPMTTLDDAVAETPHIDLLKIDVEGYERNVLRGARATLARTDAVYFESCEANFAQFGYSVDDVFALLEESGFHCYAVDPTDFHLTAVGKGRRCVQGYENLLARREARRDRRHGVLHAASGGV